MAGTLDAGTFRRAMEGYAEALRAHREEIDSLNVYPFPDGDTGTNLLVTQEAVVGALAEMPPGGPGLDEVGEAAATGALLGARGNSGVILSQVLRALAQAWGGPASVEAGQVAEGLGHAAEEARRAVARPAEGTVLTVLRDAARAATDRAGADEAAGCEEVLRAALEEARRSLARTREVLPELRAAGVVDAGAKGFVLLVAALHAAVAGRPVAERAEPLGPVARTLEPLRDPSVPGGQDLPSEVQFLVETGATALPSLRRDLAAVGDSVVVVGGGELFSVHVHTGNPDAAVQVGAAAGRVRNVRITELVDRAWSCPGGQARSVRKAEQSTAMVVLVEGPGLVRTFASLGADVVPAGPHGPPSMQAVAAAIDSAPATSVIVVPADGDGLDPAARGKAGSSKEVRVMPFGGVPGALAAAAAFNPDASVEANLARMEDAIAACRWGAVIPLGDGWQGLVGDQAVVERDSPGACVTEVASRLRPGDAELVTLIVGAGATEDERVAVGAALTGAWPELPVEVLDGGQRRHRFLIGME